MKGAKASLGLLLLIVVVTILAVTGWTLWHGKWGQDYHAEIRVESEDDVCTTRSADPEGKLLAITKCDPKPKADATTP